MLQSHAHNKNLVFVLQATEQLPYIKNSLLENFLRTEAEKPNELKLYSPTNQTEIGQ